MEEYRCLDCGLVSVPVNGRCKHCTSTALISEEIVRLTDLDYEVSNGHKEFQSEWPAGVELADRI